MPDDTRALPRPKVEARRAAPEADSHPRSAWRPQPEPPGKRSRRGLLRWGLFLLLPLALIVGFYFYAEGGAWMTTNDAYIQADRVGLSTDVSGMVKSVAVTDNQEVKAGQVLVRLDPEPFRLKLEEAGTQLRIARDTINALKANYKNLQAQIAEAAAKVPFDRRQYERAQILVQHQAAAQTTLEQAQVNFATSQQKVAALRAQLQEVAANLSGKPAAPLADYPQYRKALAARDDAARELRDSVIRAPYAGRVTNVPQLQPGMSLPASTTAFYLVSADHLWVEAQPKETALTYVRPGQKATITVDTYPGRKWHGEVASIAPASQSEFSLLPAENTSGNWVKVVQRIPMRVRIDTSDRAMPPLRAGMSAEVSVYTGHQRGMPQFLAALFGGGGNNGKTAGRGAG
jgi:membrane fusion protein, multidrug efflux system